MLVDVDIFLIWKEIAEWFQRFLLRMDINIYNIVLGDGPKTIIDNTLHTRARPQNNHWDYMYTSMYGGLYKIQRYWTQYRTQCSESEVL